MLASDCIVFTLLAMTGNETARDLYYGEPTQWHTVYRGDIGPRETRVVAPERLR